MRSKERDGKGRKLTAPWGAIHSAIWLLGLAVLAWQGWWWPGILVLVAISVLAEAFIVQIAPGALDDDEDEDEEEAAVPESRPAPAPAPAAPAPAAEPEHRIELLPSECPKCGAPVHGNDVRWTGKQSADCPYCGANLPMHTP